MNKSLRYISISHKTATVIQRSHYHISDDEMNKFVGLVRKEFNDISGLFLLATCNRTDIYFESVNTTATMIRDFLIKFKTGKNDLFNRRLFCCSNITEKTVRRLLEVSAGLESSVLGDAEIIHQIKKAHHFAIAHHLQGSLLERALQAVFKSHKRISNETQFRDGTTSLAYKSLKIIKDVFEKNSLKNKKILFVGAGDIVKQLFKYNAKFNYNNIYISNRTKERAIFLSRENQCSIYDWNKVLENDFNDFDVIISAVSNYQHLIKNIPANKQKVLLIDLSVQGSIDRELASQENIRFYDLDAISEDLKDVKDKRFAAVDEVNKIVLQELSFYCEWLEEAPLRELLQNLKITINNKVRSILEVKDEQKIKAVTNQVMRKIIHRQSKILRPYSKINAIISEQVNLYINTP